jgi:hypothetical protein
MLFFSYLNCWLDFESFLPGICDSINFAMVGLVEPKLMIRVKHCGRSLRVSMQICLSQQMFCQQISQGPVPFLITKLSLEKGEW